MTQGRLRALGLRQPAAALHPHVHALLLERMTPSQWVETMPRNNPYLLLMESQREFAPILRRLGHSDEGIYTLWSWLNQ